MSRDLHWLCSVYASILSWVCAHLPMTALSGATESFWLHSAHCRFQPPPSRAVVILAASDPTYSCPLLSIVHRRKSIYILVCSQTVKGTWKTMCVSVYRARDATCVAHPCTSRAPINCLPTSRRRGVRVTTAVLRGQSYDRLSQLVNHCSLSRGIVF